MRFLQVTIPVFILLLLSSCSVSNSITNDTTSLQSKKITSGLIHTVYFWYKDNATPEEIADFEKSLIALGTIKSIDYYYYGPPAKTAVRGPVDNSFDVCANIFFKDITAHDAYQVDPIHLGFVEEFKDLWEKVIVYDNVIEK